MHCFRFAKIFLVVLLFSQLATKNVYAIPQKNLTIFAEPNLTLAMTKLARIYSRQSNIVVSVNFNSSQELLDQIDQGDPADLFISAHKKAIADVKQKGLADYYNIGFFARDEMVLVGSSNKENPTADMTLDSYLKQLAQKRATVITDHEGSSSGSYTINYLDRFKSSNLKVFNKVAEDETPILQLIKANRDQYGLLFASQIHNDDELQILAKSKKDDIFYQALVIVGYNMDNAREFLKFLKSDTAKIVLKESGFVID